MTDHAKYAKRANEWGKELTALLDDEAALYKRVNEIFQTLIDEDHFNSLSATLNLIMENKDQGGYGIPVDPKKMGDMFMKFHEHFGSQIIKRGGFETPEAPKMYPKTEE